MKLFLSRRAFLFLSICVLAGHAVLAQTNILFVGNSFTYGYNDPVASFDNSQVTDANGTHYGGVPGIFKELTTEAGLSYNVTIEAVPNQTLVGHYATASSIIGQAGWDDVVFQENSTVPLPSAHGGNPTSFYTGAAELQNLVLKNNPSANLFLYETWASPTSVTNQSYGSGTTGLQAMQTDLQNAYYKAFYDDGFTGVARVGDAFMAAVDDGLADPNPADGISPGTIDLWNTDIRHASLYGSYLAAAVLFAKITDVNPTLLSYPNSAAYNLGISQANFIALNQIAYDINAAADPAEVVTPPPTATLNTLKAGTNLNWNATANWGHALATTDAVLINSTSAAISQVANSLDGSGHASSIQTLSFDIGATTKTVQPNLTTQNPRTLTLTGGTDALGGTDLIHLSATTTGTASIGANTGFSTLTIVLATSGSFNVENAAGILSFGPSSILSGNVNLTKTGAGTLMLAGVNTFGGVGKTFTINSGKVLANTPVSGTNSATGVGSVMVESGATLGGSGQITPGAGNQVSVLIDGVVAPGSSGIGTLTFNGANTTLNVLTMTTGSKFLFELNSTGPGDLESDRIALVGIGAGGGVAFNGNTIDFKDLSGGRLPAGSYTLFTSTGANSYQSLTTAPGGFITAGLSIGGGLGSYGASNLQLVGNNIVLNVAAVPEPGTTGLIWVGFLLVVTCGKWRSVPRSQNP